MFLRDDALILLLFTEALTLKRAELENFEGLNAYQKLKRKELINTVKTNRMTLDALVGRLLAKNPLQNDMIISCHCAMLLRSPSYCHL